MSNCQNRRFDEASVNLRIFTLLHGLEESLMFVRHFDVNLGCLDSTVHELHKLAGCRETVALTISVISYQ